MLHSHGSTTIAAQLHPGNKRFLPQVQDLTWLDEHSANSALPALLLVNNLAQLQHSRCMSSDIYLNSACVTSSGTWVDLDQGMLASGHLGGTLYFAKGCNPPPPPPPAATCRP